MPQIVLKIGLLCLIMAGLTGCGAEYSGKKQPLAKHGVLDLRNWDLSRNGPINLAGEWEFYWNQLLQPQDFNKKITPISTGNIDLPRVWNGYMVASESLSGKGYATFRLSVLLPDAHEFLAIIKFGNDFCL